MLNQNMHSNSVRGTEYFVLLKSSFVSTKLYNVKVTVPLLIGTTEYLTVYPGCHIKRMSLYPGLTVYTYQTCHPRIFLKQCRPSNVTEHEV